MVTFISKHSGHLFRGIEKNPYELWEDDKGKYIKMFTDKGSFIFDYEDLEKVKYFIDNNGKKTYNMAFKKRT